MTASAACFVAGAILSAVVTLGAGLFLIWWALCEINLNGKGFGWSLMWREPPRWSDVRAQLERVSRDPRPSSYGRARR